MEKDKIADIKAAKTALRQAWQAFTIAESAYYAARRKADAARPNGKKWAAALKVCFLFSRKLDEARDKLVVAQTAYKTALASQNA